MNARASRLDLYLRLSFFLLLSITLVAEEVIVSGALSYGKKVYHHESLRYEKEGEILSFARVAFLLSEFAFETEDSQIHPLSDQVFFFQASSKNKFVRLETPPLKGRKITALRFSVGLPASINLVQPHRFQAKDPLNPVVNNLHWSQETGYIFMALEGVYRLPKQSRLQGFSLHYAREHNFLPLRLELPRAFSSLRGIQLNLDLEALLKGISFESDGRTTHSKVGDPLAAKLKDNLSKAFRIDKVNGETPREALPQPRKLPLNLPKAKENLQGYPLKIGSRFPIPALPTDNPLIKTRVELGRALFHDPILSVNSQKSCASCHEQKAAFSQNSTTSKGVFDQSGKRNSMPLFNLAWKEFFFWDGRAKALRQQVLDPITDPHELGEDMPRLIKKLAATPRYPELFAKAFDTNEITEEKVSLALEAFLLTLTSYDSKFDQSMKGEAELTPQEKEGFRLFMTEYEPRLGAYGADCFHCHGGALFTDHQFKNNGLGDTTDLGRYNETQKDQDKGKFLTPSLRNIALTAPYMHDGRFETLEEVLNHYSSGITHSEELSPVAPNLSKHGGAGIPLTEANKEALVAFLKTLSDPQYEKKTP